MENIKKMVSVRLAISNELYRKFKYYYPDHGDTSLVLRKLLRHHLEQLDGTFKTPNPALPPSRTFNPVDGLD